METSRSACRQLASPSVDDKLDSKLQLVKPMRRGRVLSANTSMENASVGAQYGAADELPIGTGSTFTITKASFPVDSIRPFGAQSPAPLAREKRPESTTNRLASLQARWNDPPAAAAHCRLFFDPIHRAGSCPLTANDRDRQKLLDTREVTFQKNCMVSA